MKLLFQKLTYRLIGEKGVVMTDKQRNMIQGMNLLMREINKHSDDTTFTVYELICLSNKVYDEILKDGQ